MPTQIRYLTRLHILYIRVSDMNSIFVVIFLKKYENVVHYTSLVMAISGSKSLNYIVLKKMLNLNDIIAQYD